MKTTNKRKMIISIIVAVAVITSTAFIIADAVKQSDPLPEADAYGDFVDSSKLSLQKTAAALSGESVTVSYARTENMSDTACGSRFDDYGTYDVFFDVDMNEYYYLYDTNILCGILGANNEPDDPETDPITEEKAIEYAEAFLDSIRTATAYSFVSAEYMDTGMYYEITYVFPVFTYKTDDIMRIWVTADGRVSSFSEFMYGRYDSLKTSSAWCNGVESAKTSLQASIAAALTGANYSINDYYLTYNDDGDLEVVAAVSCSKAVETGINTSELLEFKQSV